MQPIKVDQMYTIYRRHLRLQADIGHFQGFFLCQEKLGKMYANFRSNFIVKKIHHKEKSWHEVVTIAKTCTINEDTLPYKRVAFGADRPGISGDRSI